MSSVRGKANSWRVSDNDNGDRGDVNGRAWTVSESMIREEQCLARHRSTRSYDAFAELRKETASSVMSVRMEQVGTEWMDLHETSYSSVFLEIWGTNSRLINLLKTKHICFI